MFAREQKDLMREKELHGQSRCERTSVEIKTSREKEFNHLNLNHIVKGLKYMRFFTNVITLGGRKTCTLYSSLQR
jgi:hypothetical protein